ncbi:hypothetical protein CH380_06815 [Leptospira adleri]|uniref:Uncharacterized protein n=1 Tax=Leptospira adleri TaxID=2023186 RepID=A0A2M9YRT9_9LEPT|nr:hypothetical protein CH380_06815 [Leptospira adleri]PJZ62369.1 hypothetical protein CH376_08425 [Leptospira adleri]
MKSESDAKDFQHEIRKESAHSTESFRKSSYRTGDLGKNFRLYFKIFLKELRLERTFQSESISQGRSVFLLYKILESLEDHFGAGLEVRTSSYAESRRR